MLQLFVLLFEYQIKYNLVSEVFRLLDYKDSYILNLLVTSNQTLNIKDISKLIGISQRSSYYSMSRINDFLESQGFNKLVNKRSEGIVVDSDGGDPIEEATVSVTLSGGVYTFNSSASTNENGEFMIEQLPVGSYDLIVSADTYDDNNISGIAVTTGVTNDIGVIELTPSTP